MPYRTSFGHLAAHAVGVLSVPNGAEYTCPTVCCLPYGHDNTIGCQHYQPSAILRRQAWKFKKPISEILLWGIEDSVHLHCRNHCYRNPH